MDWALTQRGFEACGCSLIIWAVAVSEIDEATSVSDSQSAGLCAEKAESSE